MAAVYADGTFARTNLTLSTGSNTFTAIAQDTNGVRATNIITLNVPASSTFSYDLNGNMVGDGIRVFDYDDDNQLIRITATNQWKSEFVYDGLMRRRIVRDFSYLPASSSWLLTNEVRYVYDGSLVVQERDSNNIPCVTYSRGLDLSGGFQSAGGIGGLLARTDNALMRRVGSSALQASAFYHADGNGNITMMVDAIQNIVARYQYDPYGNPLGISGSLADANTYRFSSKEFHVPSGLPYYGRRYYNPGLQRWINADPIGEYGGLNLYGFVGNDPQNWLDSFGLEIGDWYNPLTYLWPSAAELQGQNRLDAWARSKGYSSCQNLQDQLNQNNDPTGFSTDQQLTKERWSALQATARNATDLTEGYLNGPVPEVKTAAAATSGAVIIADAARKTGLWQKAKSLFTKGTCSAKSGETAFTKAGRDAHKLYNPGPSYDLKVRLPSGKKPDAVDFDAKIVRELKPNNPRAIQRGERQLEGYLQELEEVFGGNWKGSVDTYNR
ncbi:MAG: RHS repeat-associated core domain-containing protein [Verrucomicrobiota bacterium]